MTLTGPFKQILTMDNLPLKGHLSDDQLEIIPDGGILHQHGKILEIGKYEQLKHKNPDVILERIDGEYLVLPGMIDVHTHICWAGSRINDFAQRLYGKNYLEIAESGGGIWSTVEKTRKATLIELTELTAQRAQKLLSQGITTIEVKSGYGLSVEDELKILEAIKLADRNSQVDIISTCLAAHILPTDFDGDENDYLEEMAKKLLPEIKKKNLSKRIDIFVEKSAFSTFAARNYLLKAKEMGFEITIHGDQFTSGSATLANEVQALSIDHLEAADDDEIALLAKGNVIPVVLPGASIGLGQPFAPAHKLLNAGTSLVIASDWNPGSAPMGNLLTEASILGTYEKLAMAEVWAAITCRAAAALNKTDRGILTAGLKADFIAFKTNDFREIIYRQGDLKPEKVWKNGVLHH
ncbi:MAG: imidazolonepropionase [Paludibacter sp.]|nr:imidazolonepropionase [Paludibacter sp.]